MALQALACASKNLNKLNNGAVLARHLSAAAAKPNRNPKIEYTQVGYLYNFFI